MQTVEHSSGASDTQRGAIISHGASAIQSLTYHSRSVGLMSRTELQALLVAAQVRNRQEGVTGLVIYDDGRFFQCLEGPAEGLARIWNSVRRDPRHTAIEMVDEHYTSTRSFTDWDLRLSTRSGNDGSTRPDDLSLPADLIESLYRYPNAAASLLARVATNPELRRPAVIVSAVVAEGFERRAHSRLQADAQSVAQTGTSSDRQTILLRALKTSLIPALAARHGVIAVPVTEIDPRLAERAEALAKLVMASDPDAAFAFVAERFARNESIRSLRTTLFEPAARYLGDLWQNDDCSEFDVTVGLGRLQTILRRLSGAHVMARAEGLPVVLVAPQPGEIHLLGSALDAELLWNSGWDAHCEFPATDAALLDLLGGTWFDALDLGLSVAFQREHWLPRMSVTIERARRASRNPGMVVVVNGRVFFEQNTVSQTVGADAANATALESGLLGLVPAPTPS